MVGDAADGLLWLTSDVPVVRDATAPVIRGEVLGSSLKKLENLSAYGPTTHPLRYSLEGRRRGFISRRIG